MKSAMLPASLILLALAGACASDDAAPEASKNDDKKTAVPRDREVKPVETKTPADDDQATAIATAGSAADVPADEPAKSGSAVKTDLDPIKEDRCLVAPCEPTRLTEQPDLPFLEEM